MVLNKVESSGNIFEPDGQKLLRYILHSKHAFVTKFKIKRSSAFISDLVEQTSNK